MFLNLLGCVDVVADSNDGYLLKNLRKLIYLKLIDTVLIESILDES